MNKRFPVPWEGDGKPRGKTTRETCTARSAAAHLPRAHRAVANLKAWLHGSHRSASAKHLPVYLDEFTFRHNRRRTPMAAFQTLLCLGALHEPSTYREITERAA